jgi:hypothetical protein
MSDICRCWGVSGVVQPSIIKAITAASPDRKLMQLPYNIMPHCAKKAPPRRDRPEAITDIRARCAIVDRGYRGRKFVDGTEVLVPGRAPRGQSRAKSAAMRKRFRRRAAIEPVISHLKADFRLLRCFLKGFQGDQLNPDAGRRPHGTSANGCGCSPFFGFASFARSPPKMSTSRYKDSPESFSGPTK